MCEGVIQPNMERTNTSEWGRCITRTRACTAQGQRGTRDHMLYLPVSQAFSVLVWHFCSWMVLHSFSCKNRAVVTDPHIVHAGDDCPYLHCVAQLLLHSPALLLLHGAALPLVHRLALLPTLRLQEALLRHLGGLPDQGAGLPILLERSSKWMRNTRHQVTGYSEEEEGLEIFNY